MNAEGHGQLRQSGEVAWHDDNVAMPTKKTSNRKTSLNSTAERGGAGKVVISMPNRSRLHTRAVCLHTNTNEPSQCCILCRAKNNEKTIGVLEYSYCTTRVLRTFVRTTPVMYWHPCTYLYVAPQKKSVGRATVMPFSALQLSNRWSWNFFCKVIALVRSCLLYTSDAADE